MEPKLLLFSYAWQVHLCGLTVVIPSPCRPRPMSGTGSFVLLMPLPELSHRTACRRAEATSVGEKRVGWADPPGKAFGMAPGGYPRGQEQRPHEQETFTFLLGQQDILL